ncbi:beta-lactamase [Shewanella sp. A32]|uniref:class C beta-lactamase n=1 Tax=Shewanella sp. A32 TaxID=3031327 RepID=UPI0023B8CA59|nr:class C beta-lactamase [Shewanella sp. A32]MDF0534105.1 beta-lactamase [Shewanella sp. A32]
MKRATLLSALMLSLLFTSVSISAAATTQPIDAIKPVVDAQAAWLMNQYQIPGMAFGLTVNGMVHYFSYGLADQQSNTPVTENTLFELGSVSKTFAATLACYAEQQGRLWFNDKVSRYLPELSGSVIGNTKLIDLATYTAGGLPLQFPDTVTNQQQMLAYFHDWQPIFPAATQRQYSNPSIGLFGYISALSLHADYRQLVAQHIFKNVGMTNSYIDVPKDKMAQYAYGYNAEGKAVRVNPGVLDAEAYGIKSTSADMVRYIQANMGELSLAHEIQTALNNTKTGYYRASSLIQGLAWELYPYPVTLQTLLQGNAAETILQPHPITPLSPSLQSQQVWVNKTGSTGGFGAYVAFIPSQHAGIVILANKYYPNTARVNAAYQILTAAMRPLPQGQ